MEPITWNDFERVHLCVGTVLSAEDLPNAREPAYVLTIDLGPHGIKRSSARITRHYTKEELIGKQVVAVVNFPEKQIGNIMAKDLKKLAEELVNLSVLEVNELGTILKDEYK